ncbi:hypothetical protein RISK_005645 [Rhodopirellula islandica]|uniref:Uncharacterized protein n=1 Tax=Rhodopirellula islandica TaxID=595434 RepID=A0A0J1EAH6_RHOIS|nr:hypothetical protein RISK_005645 [Rhodopirellula islandica]
MLSGVDFSDQVSGSNPISRRGPMKTPVFRDQAPIPPPRTSHRGFFFSRRATVTTETMSAVTKRLRVVNSTGPP